MEWGGVAPMRVLWMCILLASVPFSAGVRPLCWSLGRPVVEGSGVSVELWGDFQCSETARAWLDVAVPLLRWSDAHGVPLSLTFHPFPLPYLCNAHAAALAAQAATDRLVTDAGVARPQAFLKVAERLLLQQDRFQGRSTVNMTAQQIWGEVLWPIASAGVLGPAAGAPGSDAKLRLSSKRGWARGVGGTPAFAVNGVVADSAATWSLEEWKQQLLQIGSLGTAQAGSEADGGVDLDTPLATAATPSSSLTVLIVVGEVLVLSAMSAAFSSQTGRILAMVFSVVLLGLLLQHFH